MGDDERIATLKDVGGLDDYFYPVPPGSFLLQWSSKTDGDVTTWTLTRVPFTGVLTSAVFQQNHPDYTDVQEYVGTRTFLVGGDNLFDNHEVSIQRADGSIQWVVPMWDRGCRRFENLDAFMAERGGRRYGAHPLTVGELEAQTRRPFPHAKFITDEDKGNVDPADIRADANKSAIPFPSKRVRSK